jgi:hypothetical protein
VRTCEDGCNGCDECTDYDEPIAATVCECRDNDSPWLVCKPCNAAGRCSKDDTTPRETYHEPTVQ